MKYFDNLKEKWGTTKVEREKIKKLQEIIDRGRGFPYTGKSVKVMLQDQKDIEEANKAERRVSRIKSGIIRRRRKAFFGG